MAAKSIPFVGEPYLGDEPCVMKLAKVTYGVSSGSPDVTISATSDAGAADTLFSLPDNCVIHDVGWKVTESFTNGITLTLGSSTDADGFAPAATLGATDGADSVINWMSKLGMAALAGATFPTSDTVFPALYGGFETASATDYIQAGSAAVEAAAGMVEVYVMYSMVAAI